jgi:glutamyl-tRNA reductase
MNKEISKLVVIGISHKTSTLAEREKFQINKKDMPGALLSIGSIIGVEGVVIISTCNRLEFYLTINSEVEPLSIINHFYRRKGIIKTPVNEKLFYLCNGISAAKHLFKVAAGLDSMLIGEYQIQGQVKDAYSIACSQNTADKMLHKLFHSAFRVGKAVRTKTKIGSCNQSLSGVAFKIMKERLKKEDAITIVGVNQNTKIIADKLTQAGFSHLLFVNRKLYKAEELADKYNGLAFALDYIEEPMISSKCVFSCTGAPGYIIDAELINKVYSKNKQPKLLIDMAAPRDINTEGLKNDVEVIDLEGLKKYMDKEKEDIELDISEAEKIISGEVCVFEAWNESQKDETLCLLDEKMEMARLQLLDEMSLQSSVSELEILDKFSKSLSHRMKTVFTQTIKTKPAS